MANNVDLATLRSKIRAREEVRSVYVSNGDLDQWINDSIKDLWDRIIAVNQDWLVKVSDQFQLRVDIEDYPLPSDFSHLVRVEVLYNAPADWRPLTQFNLAERSNYNWFVPTLLFYRYRLLDDRLFISPIPNETVETRLWYIPVPPELVEDGDEVDFIFGWDEYVILNTIEMHRNKEDTDASPILQKKVDVLDRILTRAQHRNYTDPDTIRDTDEEYYYAKYPWIRGIG